MSKIARLKPEFASLQDEDKGIVDVDGFVHVVRGKVICFGEGVYDLSDPIDRSLLSDFAKRLYVDPALLPAYGRDTVCVLVPSGREESHGILCMDSIKALPEDVRDVIRGAHHGYR